MNRFFCYSNYPSLTQQNHWGPSLSPELLTPRREGSRCSQSSSLAVPNMMWVSEEQGWGYTPPVNSQRCRFDQNQLRIWSESPSLPRTPCHIKKSIHCTDGLLKISFFMWPPLSRTKISFWFVNQQRKYKFKQASQGAGGQKAIGISQHMSSQ